MTIHRYYVIRLSIRFSKAYASLIFLYLRFDFHSLQLACQAQQSPTPSDTKLTELTGILAPFLSPPPAAATPPPPRQGQSSSATPSRSKTSAAIAAATKAAGLEVNLPPPSYTQHMISSPSPPASLAAVASPPASLAAVASPPPSMMMSPPPPPPSYQSSSHDHSSFDSYESQFSAGSVGEGGEVGRQERSWSGGERGYESPEYIYQVFI